MYYLKESSIISRIMTKEITTFSTLLVWNPNFKPKFLRQRIRYHDKKKTLGTSVNYNPISPSLLGIYKCSSYPIANYMISTTITHLHTLLFKGRTQTSPKYLREYIIKAILLRA